MAFMFTKNHRYRAELECGKCRCETRCRYQTKAIAAKLKPATKEIQNPVAAIGAAGRQGNQLGAKPSAHPKGIEITQNASIWMIMGVRVTL